jgi:transposase
MEQTMQQRRRRRVFTPAFKAEVVELCRKGNRSIPEVARDLDLTETAVRRWVTQAEIDRGSQPGLTSSEQAEQAQLRQENRQLREDLGIMKRAAAFMWTLRLCGSGRGRRPWQIRNKG